MLKNIALVISVALLVTACASNPPVAARAKQPPAGCVAETATRVPVSPQDCAGFGRTWTDKDVKSTGATDAGQALRQLDPTVVVTH